MIQLERNKTARLTRSAWRLFCVMFCVALAMLPQAASAATLYAGSAYQSVYEGQTFVIDWYLDSQKENLNTVSLDLHFTPETLEVVQVEPGQSLLSLWVKPPEFSNTDGQIHLAGGVPGGFISDRAPLFRTVFRGLSSGPAQITMDSSSAVLLNDGQGSQAPLQFQVLNFAVAPKGSEPIVVRSATHPDQNAWYRENRVVLQFAPKNGEEYSYSFSSNLEITPPDQKMAVPAEITYESLPDGIYYFKLNSKIGNSRWQEAAVYRVQIDATPPERFLPLIAADPSTFGGKPFLSFSTVDKTSGMSHYKIRIGLFEKFHETRSPVELFRPVVGDEIMVQAIDAAGNVRTVTIKYPGYISQKSFFVLGGIVVVLLGGLLIRTNRGKIKKLKQKI